MFKIIFSAIVFLKTLLIFAEYRMRFGNIKQA